MGNKTTQGEEGEANIPFSGDGSTIQQGENNTNVINNNDKLEKEKQNGDDTEQQQTLTPETVSAPATPEYPVHNRRLDRELAEDSSGSVASLDTEPVSPSRKNRGKLRRGKEKSQSTLRFSVAESPDSSEREKGEVRKTRKPLGESRRRRHRAKNDQDSEDESDSDDVRKRTPHRRSKKRIDDTSSSSSRYMIIITIYY